MGRRVEIGSLDPGARVTGLNDYPLAIYQIVDQGDLGAGIDLNTFHSNEVVLMNTKSGRLRSVDDFSMCTALDPKDQWNQTKNAKNAKKEETKTMGHRFDESVGKVKSNVASTAKTTAIALAEIKAGQAILTSLKSSIKTVPGFPKKFDFVLESDWADIVIGGTLAFIVPMVTSSPKINMAAKAAGMAATVAASGKLSFIENIIDGVISKVPDVLLSDGKDAPTKE